MKRFHALADAGHTRRPGWTPMTLNWTEFAVVAVVILLVLLLTGLAVW